MVKGLPVLAAIAAAALGLVAGCSAGADGGDAAAPSPAVSATSTPSASVTAQTFDTVVEFKDALVASGYACDPWKPDSEKEKGTCNDAEDLLVIYDDAGAMASSVADYKNDAAKTYPIAYGGNWLIIVDTMAQANALAARMGGSVYTPTSTPTPTPTVTPPTVTLHDCYDTDLDDLDSEIVISDLESPDADFSKVWPMKIQDCYKATRSKGPLTKREQKALAASGYKKKEVADLYLFCAQNDKDDYYNDKGTKPNDTQIAELEGWMILCPNHPQAKAWKAAIKRGEKEQKLKKAGRSFNSGTYRVGKEIKPGTYYVKGDIENCYWERQDRNGNTIDNNFVTSARRVQVTIRSSDYAFSSEGCGNWRPAN